jgi:thiol-disulfide isomerase/thioredoxin
MKNRFSVHIANVADSVFLAFKKDTVSFLLTAIAGRNGPGNLLLNIERKNINKRLVPIFAGDFTTAAIWDSLVTIERESKQKVRRLRSQKLITDSFSELLSYNTETLLLHELYSFSFGLLSKKDRKEQARQIIDSACKRYYPLRPTQLTTDGTALTNAYKYVRSINEMRIPAADPAVSKADESWAAIDIGYAIASQLPEPYREAHLANNIMIEYFYLNDPKAKNAILLFAKQYPSGAYASFFLQAIMGENKFSNQNGAATISVEPSNNNAAIQYISTGGGLPELIQMEFKGKFVLIDCWATWCVNCIAEFPYYEKHEVFLKENNIERLFISFDKGSTVQGWRPMTTNKNIKGNHIIAYGKLEKDILSVSGIKEDEPLPRYLLIGPDGKILSSDFDRPSSPEFINRLKAFLEKS